MDPSTLWYLAGAAILEMGAFWAKQMLPKMKKMNGH